ncbi:MAG TPA: RNA polymerase sigma factor [Gammaproteobacteria bacterium]|nr:RNA polymerase sigma factor [Gammaproteobacteria bacterium]
MRTNAAASATLADVEAEVAADEDLMLRYAAGEAAAFDALYERHKGGVYRYLLRQLRDQTLAEELFQDIWLNLINARGRYRVRAKFTTWLYTLARNRLTDHYRRQKGVVAISFDVPEEEEEDNLQEPEAPSSEQPERRLLAQEQLARFIALVEGLPMAQREAFLLHEEGGLGIDEIAAATGVNRETAKSRLRYAIAKLKAGMDDCP